MTEEKYKELKLPAEVKSLAEYKQCIMKIRDWFYDNNFKILNPIHGTR